MSQRERQRYYLLKMAIGGKVTLSKTVTKTGDDNRPEWTTEDTFMEKDDIFFYTGGVIGRADYALTLRLAKSEAIKNLLESVEIKARVEFNNALHGQNRNDTCSQ
jgi:hypothetical protein